MRTKDVTTHFSKGDRLIFIDVEKITLPYGLTVVNIPIGTVGTVEKVEDAQQGSQLYTIRCKPATTANDFTFIAASDNVEFLQKVALLSQIDPLSLPPMSEQHLYDNDMPGYLRGQAEYLVSDPEGDYLLFQRKAFTDWIIEVKFYKSAKKLLNDVSGVFRSTTSDGKEIEQFTLMCKKVTYVLVQVQLFSAKRIRTYTTIPAEIDIDSRNKVVRVLILSNFEPQGDGQLKIWPVE
jgi:hypothetical protein